MRCCAVWDGRTPGFVLPAGSNLIRERVGFDSLKLRVAKFDEHKRLL